MRTGAGEAGLLRACAEYLIWQGWLVIRVNSGASTPERADGSQGFIPFNRWQTLGADEQQAGIADLLAFKDGLNSEGCIFLAIECKMPGKKPSQMQSVFLEGVKNHGGVPIVAYSIDDIQRVLVECGLLQEVA